MPALVSCIVDGCIEIYNMKKKKDKKEPLWKKQREKRGFDDRDTWSLDHTLGKWLAPRLKRYKEVNCIVGPTDKGRNWDQILDEMIFAYDFLGSERRWDSFDKKEWKRVESGLKLFAKYCTSLWW